MQPKGIVSHAPFLIPAALAVALCAVPAYGQDRPAPCDDREKWVDYLVKRYQEGPAVFALTNRGSLLEVFVSEGGQSWSILLTNTKGLSCFMDGGVNWREVEPVNQDPET